MNIIIADNYDYIFPNDKECMYYNNISRKDFFSPAHNNAGFDLLMQYGCWCLLVINDYIFVHGQINYLSYASCKFLNQILNNNSKIKKQKYRDIVYGILNNGKGILWERTFGNAKEISENTCEQLEAAFFFFYNGHRQEERIESETDCLPDHTTFKLVIGHCQQYISSHKNLVNTTYVDVDVIHSNDKRIYYSGEGVNGKPLHRYNMTGNTLMHDNLIFGISMQCQTQEDRNKYKLYRVDVGASRSFDISNDITRLLDKSNRELQRIFNPLNLTRKLKQQILYYSRTPSVLLIKNTSAYNSNSIIKSTLRNTIHKQPRLELNKNINTYKALAKFRINELTESNQKLNKSLEKIDSIGKKDLKESIIFFTSEFIIVNDIINKLKSSEINKKYNGIIKQLTDLTLIINQIITLIDTDKNQFEAFYLDLIYQLVCELNDRINIVDSILKSEEKELLELNELTVIDINKMINIYKNRAIFRIEELNDSKRELDALLLIFTELLTAIDTIDLSNSELFNKIDENIDSILDVFSKINDIINKLKLSKSNKKLNHIITELSCLSKLIDKISPLIEGNDDGYVIFANIEEFISKYKELIIMIKSETIEQRHVIDKILELEKKELLELTDKDEQYDTNYNYDDSVFNKYLKYKNKYLQLKKNLLNYI